MLHARQSTFGGRGPQRPAPPGRSDAGTVIPYDTAASFRLTGRPGNLIQDVINISADGTFVAVAIGYGFEEERERPIVGPDELQTLAGSAPIVVGDLELRGLPLGSLIEGLRVNPKFAPWLFGDAASIDTGAEGAAGSDSVPEERVFRDLLQRVKAAEEISFLFSMIDSGTGREFQDQPAHNLATLGKSNGERPFRMLAQPFHFAPRSTLRLQVTERTEGARGTLFIVLYGYRVLANGCPQTVARQLRGPPMCPTETIGNPNARIIPFDYVSTLQLTGRRGNQLEDELTVNVDGGFVATSIGYGLSTNERRVTMQMGAVADIQDATLREELLKWVPGAKINLGHLPLRLFPPSALLDGVRLRPGWLRVALEDNGNLATQLPFDLLDSLFERLNRPEDVSFRYALFDTGTGRELQNQRINNVAGLGIADGDRPFKRLARPMIFLPRSTIRIEIEEVFGRGTLFIALHGYKLLDQQGGPSHVR